jgi:hypothetical protein
MSESLTIQEGFLLGGGEEGYTVAARGLDLMCKVESQKGFVIRCM